MDENGEQDFRAVWANERARAKAFLIYDEKQQKPFSEAGSQVFCKSVTTRSQFASWIMNNGLLLSH